MSEQSSSRSPRARWALAVLVIAGGLAGCRGAVPREILDADLVRALRVSPRPDFPTLDEYERREVVPTQRARGHWGQAVLGTALAVFPGILAPGVGHLYAGDGDTGRKLLRIGGLGYILMAAGGGLAYGGYEAYDNDVRGLGLSLMGTGGVIAGAGALFSLSAWGYDVIDTPRAVFSGGEPPPRSDFVDSLDLFSD